MYVYSPCCKIQSLLLFIKCLTLKLVNDMSSVKIGALIICQDVLGTKPLNLKLTVLLFDLKLQGVYLSKIH